MQKKNELEETQSKHNNLLEELNDIVTKQQIQIDQLILEIKRIRDSQKAAEGATQSDAIDEQSQEKLVHNILTPFCD